MAAHRLPHPKRHQHHQHLRRRRTGGPPCEPRRPALQRLAHHTCGHTRRMHPALHARRHPAHADQRIQQLIGRLRRIQPCRDALPALQGGSAAGQGGHTQLHKTRQKLHRTHPLGGERPRFPLRRQDRRDGEGKRRQTRSRTRHQVQLEHGLGTARELRLPAARRTGREPQCEPGDVRRMEPRLGTPLLQAERQQGVWHEEPGLPLLSRQALSAQPHPADKKRRQRQLLPLQGPRPGNGNTPLWHRHRRAVL